MAVKKKSIRKKTTKKTSSKPKKQVKSSSKKPEFEKAWKDYNSALNGWKESLAQWQKATNETLMTYHDACPEYIKQQTKMMENIFKETNIESIKKFNGQWEKFLKTSGDDSIVAYQEAIKKFNQAWQSGQM